MSQQSTILSLITGAQADVDARFAKLLNDAAGVPADSVTPPPVVVVPPPVIPVADITKTIRFANAKNLYKINANGFTAGQEIQSIPDVKGKLNLLYNSDPTSNTNTLTGKKAIYCKEGFAFFQNIPGNFYNAQAPGGAPYPLEAWFVFEKPNFFLEEAFIKGWGNLLYVGDLLGQTGIRTTNDNDTAHTFVNAVIPVNKRTLFRFRLTLNGSEKTTTQNTNVELWINGVKQTNSQQVLTFYYNVCYLQLGADTNGEYCGYHEIGFYPVLTDTIAAQITAEIQAEYNLGAAIQQPYADNIQVVNTNGKLSVTYNFISTNGLPEDKTKLRVDWIQWGSNGVTNATYIAKNTPTVNSYSGGRVEVTAFDTAGNFYSIPGSKEIK